MSLRSILAAAASLVMISAASASAQGHYPAHPPGKHKKSMGGIIAGDGSIVEGSGFSVSHDGTGEYTIDVPSGYFTDCPLVFAIGAGVPTHAAVMNDFNYINCGSGEVKIQLRAYSNSGSGAEDSAFHFMMIDP